MFKAQKGQTEAQIGYSTWAKHRKIIFLIALEIFQRVVYFRPGMNVSQGGAHLIALRFRLRSISEHTNCIPFG